MYRSASMVSGIFAAQHTGHPATAQAAAFSVRRSYAHLNQGTRAWPNAAATGWDVAISATTNRPKRWRYIYRAHVSMVLEALVSTPSLKGGRGGGVGTVSVPWTRVQLGTWANGCSITHAPSRIRRLRIPCRTQAGFRGKGTCGQKTWQLQSCRLRRLHTPSR